MENKTKQLNGPGNYRELRETGPWATPPPHFNDAKMARFLLLRAFIIALRGMGDNRLILFCPSCPRTTLALQEDIYAIQITSDLLLHVR